MYQLEYKNDMHTNYMMLKQGKELPQSRCGINMVAHNKIPGLLHMEVRVMDNINWYYYDITSKQPISMALGKGQLSREQVRLVMWNVLQIIENSKEYLLDENNFMLEPDCIYATLPRMEISLCYVAGYQKEIRSQIWNLIEYFMNKVDHREEGAALLIYSLYKVSKEENCTFTQLLELLKEDQGELFLEKAEEPQKERNKMREIAFQAHRKQITLKSVEGVPPTEEEIKVYAKSNIYYAVASVLLTLLLFFGAAKTGIVYNNRTNGIDYTKAFAVMAIVGGVEAYALGQILSEKNKITKMRKPPEFMTDKVQRNQRKQEDVSSEGQKKSYGKLQKPMEVRENVGKQDDNASFYTEEEENTVVLTEKKKEFNYRLCPLEGIKYQDILLNDFPFFIGALKMKVDYSIENPSVSRFHAKMDRQEEEFYITDLNSTNGTYVNQIRLGVQERKKIELEDEIAFADIRYRFTC